MINTCEHPNLRAVAQPYVLNEEDGETVITRTVHLSVCCAACGWPFRFEGAFLSTPDGREALLAVEGPWANHAQSEVGLRIRPFLPSEDLALTPPAGNA